MENYTIRLAIEEDAATLSQISGDWFKAQFDGTCTPDDMQSFISECFNTEAVKQEIGTAGNEYYLLESAQGEVLAYARMIPNMPAKFAPTLTQTPIELKRFYIHPDYKGKGVATELMDFILNRVEELGYDTIVLSVWEYNVRAQLFYKKYGFVDSYLSNDFPIGDTPQTDKWYIWRKDQL